MSCLPKPVLRGHIKRRGLKAIIGSLIFATVNTTLGYFFLKLRHEKNYENFLKTHDDEAFAKDLVKWGYFQTLKKQ